MRVHTGRDFYLYKMSFAAGGRTPKAATERRIAPPIPNEYHSEDEYDSISQNAINQGNTYKQNTKETSDAYAHTTPGPEGKQMLGDPNADMSYDTINAHVNWNDGGHENYLDDEVENSYEIPGKIDIGLDL